MEEVISAYGLPTLIAIGSALVGAFFSYREFRKKAYDHAKEMIDLSPETAKAERDHIRKDVDDLKDEVSAIRESVDSLVKSDLANRMLKLADKAQYYKHLEYCPIEMKGLLKSEFDRYFDEGGNHITRDLLKEVLALPNEK
ncbi:MULTISPECIES: hypothetical protein [Bacteria]|uniref:Uncharacterized protein n=1 Tax=Dubosiella newyorkensis TaxID=1862672 RepID=A0A1U7NKX1_9FIRM|nr:MULTISPECIES: hypothetical protein [Bacteria]OLU45247.1 hypothetical protein BO225_08870 [Dubosiella newyorkensis]